MADEGLQPVQRGVEGVAGFGGEVERPEQVGDLRGRWGYVRCNLLLQLTDQARTFSNVCVSASSSSAASIGYSSSSACRLACRDETRREMSRTIAVFFSNIQDAARPIQ